MSIVIRRSELSLSMSHYLVDRILADPTINVFADTQVRSLRGESHLEEVTLEHTPSGQRRSTALRCAVLFHRGGASDLVAEGHGCARPKGFVLTDRSLWG